VHAPLDLHCRESTTAVADRKLRVQMTKLPLVLVAPTTQWVPVPSGASLVANSHPIDFKKKSHPITSQYVKVLRGYDQMPCGNQLTISFSSPAQAAAMEGSLGRVWTRGARTNRFRACVGRFDWFASMTANKRPLGGVWRSGDAQGTAV
jgi:hypothetical protein